MKELIFQKELTFIKRIHQKNVCFVIIGTSNLLDLNLNHVFVMNLVLDVSFQNQKELKYETQKALIADVFYVVLAEIKLLIF